MMLMLMWVVGNRGDVGPIVGWAHFVNAAIIIMHDFISFFSLSLSFSKNTKNKLAFLSTKKRSFEILCGQTRSFLFVIRVWSLCEVLCVVVCVCAILCAHHRHVVSNSPHPTLA